MNLMYIPKRGDIIWLNFSPQKGREQAFRRPALVISREHYNRLGLVWVVPITTKTKGFFFELPLLKNTTKTKGYVLTDQVKCLDWRERDIQFIEIVKSGFVNKVVKKSEIIYR